MVLCSRENIDEDVGGYRVVWEQEGVRKFVNL